MKKKQYCLLLTGLMSLSLTGCMSFSYGNPVAEGKYDVELPNGETYEITEEEAKELQSIQEELQEDLDISDEELEQLRKEMENYEEKEDKEDIENEKEDNQEDKSSEAVTESSVQEETAPTEEETKISCLDDVMGFQYEGFSYLGAYYNLCSGGASLRDVEEPEFWVMQEYIPYGDNQVPVVCIRAINEEGFEIPEYIQYIGNPMESYEGVIGYFYNGKDIVIPEHIKYFNAGMGESAVETFTISDKTQTPDFWENWFYNCKNLKSVTIPENVTSLSGTFEGCESLIEIELPSNLKYIDDCTFKNCTNLTEITIPEGVTVIGEEAFAGSGVTSITYPEGLTHLSLSAFANTEIEELVIPDSVTETSGGIVEMLNLKKLVIPNTLNFSCISIWNCPNLELIVYPDSVTEIDIRAEEDFDKSKITIQVAENVVEYVQKKYPEYNIVAKEK